MKASIPSRIGLFLFHCICVPISIVINIYIWITDTLLEFASIIEGKTLVEIGWDEVAKRKKRTKKLEERIRFIEDR